MEIWILSYEKCLFCGHSKTTNDSLRGSKVVSAVWEMKVMEVELQHTAEAFGGV